MHAMLLLALWLSSGQLNIKEMTLVTAVALACSCAAHQLSPSTELLLCNTER